MIPAPTLVTIWLCLAGLVGPAFAEGVEALPESSPEITTRKESPAAGTAAGQLPLTPQELDRFLADWPRLIEFSRTRGEDFRSPEAKSEGFDEIFAKQASDFIRSMGWDPARFNYTLDRISAILSGLEMRDRGDKIRAVLQAERIEARHNPDLSPAQRRIRLSRLDAHERGLDENLALLKKADPLEVRLIGANRKRIMEALSGLY